MRESLDSYAKEINRALSQIDDNEFRKVIGILAEAYKNNKQIFVTGNGGSAATANHFICDFGKNAVQDKNKKRFRVLSLCDNVEKITAWGNDVAFEEIFRQQLINLMDEEDVFIVISASGNSPDLVRACQYAREKKAKIITMAGFDGGEITKFADAGFVVPLTSYEQIEDLHSILCHNIVYYFKEHQDLV